MKSNLLLFDEDSFELKKYANYYAKLQEIFNLSTVEFSNTTVFSDFEGISQKITKYLDRMTVVVMSAKANDNILNNILNIISNYYGTRINTHNSIKYCNSQMGVCVIIDNLEEFANDWDVEFFVNELSLGKLCTFMKLFGLEKNEVKQLYYEVPNATSFDMSVYCKDKISQVSIVSKQNYPKEYIDEFLRNVHLQFQNYWFADTQDSILDKLLEILSIRRLKVCVADSLTKGVFKDYLCKNEELIDNCINEIFNITQEFDYQFQLGIEQEFLDTHPKNGVDMAYEMSAVMMEKEMADIVISLCGDSDTWFISIGDCQAIHVYKYTAQENFNVVCNQAIFKLLKKVKENQLYFFENSV